jgi:TonB-dependent SusC/RagA subfamily outer membrane receptor
VLVDGIELSLDGLDTIDPRLVKSIDILKGPDASIYGSKAANGVILITLIGR